MGLRNSLPLAANSGLDFLGTGNCTFRRTSGLIANILDPGRTCSPAPSTTPWPLNDLLKGLLMIGQVLLNQLHYLNQLL